MSSLATPLRRQLENTIKQARKAAEIGARKALEALAVHEADPYRHMEKSQRDLRRKLRAQAKQLGDGESHAHRGEYEIKHLAEKLAYDQWHRLLFARFLLENNLLISPEHGVAVSLDDCEELAPSVGLKDSWAVAARFAAKELPEIFRADDPAGAVDLPIEDRKPLIQFVTGLPVEVFTASDSLGWCYQFWQAERKDEVNASGKKIGADELPSVTQLFTEDYMVDFLLDNTLGAWHAGKVLAAQPRLADTAQSEEELRNAVALPGCPWKYLRFTKAENEKWTPAAGTFDGWPKTAKELRCLDPCMGSGHFIVAMFERLVSLRMAEENSAEAEGVSAVIRDNLFGLEIDPRCTQIGAFNLALSAWRRAGHCPLPAMNLACSGLAPNAKKEDWLKLAGDSEKLQNGMERLYQLFQDAPLLGSLINPRAAKGTLLVATFHELQPLLEKALAQETQDDAAHEMAVTAHGLAKAAEILSGHFTLVSTNVPYLGRGKQEQILKDHVDRFYVKAKADLATCFVERCLDCCSPKATIALVTPISWLFQPNYTGMREERLTSSTFQFAVRLGSRAFETITGEVVKAALVILCREVPDPQAHFAAMDSTNKGNPSAKAEALQFAPLEVFDQASQRKNPDAVIGQDLTGRASLLSRQCNSYQGLCTSDDPQFIFEFWEVNVVSPKWRWLQSAALNPGLVGGCSSLLFWEDAKGRYAQHAQALKAEGRLGGWKSGGEAWDKRGVAVNVTKNLYSNLYLGDFFDNTIAALIPANPDELPAIYCFLGSDDYKKSLRELDPSLSVTEHTLLKVPFDRVYWQKVAAEKYPYGLPKPFSRDSTQWLFNGHPNGSDQSLHVAVARLLGYRWPRQIGSSFPDCPALGSDGLEELADTDGIVCLSASKGEPAGSERLRELLVFAWGKEWNAAVLDDLLAKAEHAGKTLDDWLRNGFFEQHSVLFHHRPFIWHIWDGHKSGFSALVNYHKLDHANLEKLTYAYLGDWIRRQQAAVDAGEAGSDARLQAARQLQSKLKLILEGEPPYDIFVRWKPLSKQAIGWHPDINDGVRMNIRPFATADILRKRVKIKWGKDRGKEPVRDSKEYPWFWCATEPGTDPRPGTEFTGNRWNDVHLTSTEKEESRRE